MLNIIVPMAGKGSRFLQSEYKLPKPLIEIHRAPMIEYVTRNLDVGCEHRFIYICLQEHLDTYNLESILEKISPNCKIVAVDKITEGPACSVLLAEKYINNESSLMIANSDQFVNADINHYLEKIKNYDGLIMTMPSNNPKWSFIKYNEKGFVTLVREKEVISNLATVGIYNFKHGSDFVKYAKLMISKKKHVNNEYYVAPVYNEMIDDGKKIVYGDVGKNMFGLGVPEDLKIFIENPLSKEFLLR